MNTMTDTTADLLDYLVNSRVCIAKGYYAETWTRYDFNGPLTAAECRRLEHEFGRRLAAIVGRQSVYLENDANI